MDPAILALFATVSGVFAIVFWPLLKLHHDAREPPIIRPTLPIIGHIVSLIKYSNSYYAYLRQQYPDLDCYTLQLYTSKFYVVSSLELVAAVQRNTKTLSFDPLLEFTAELLGGMSKDGMRKHKQPGISRRLLKQTHPQMWPGPAAEAMVRSITVDIARSVNALIEAGDESREIDLHKWVRDTIGIASTNAVWGREHNPFTDIETLETQQKYEQNMMPLLLGFAPRLVAKKGYEAREQVVQSFLKYKRNGGLDTASGMIKASAEVALEEADFSDDDFARLQTFLSTGVLGNIIPSSFWMIWEIFSRPELLASLREEISPLIVADHEGAHGHLTLEISDLRTKAPLLLSLFQEVIRVRSVSASVRFVLEDTLLAGKYLLKKGGIVQMPSAVMHADESIWGSPPKRLDPRRFVAFLDGNAKVNPISYRGFGGGDHVCPGRFFAAAEVLPTMAMMLMTFDMEPESGRWVEPPPNTSMFSSSILPPKGEVPVLLSKRAEFSGREWRVTLNDTQGRFKLASG